MRPVPKSLLRDVAEKESINESEVVGHLRATNWDEATFEKFDWRNEVPSEIADRWGSLSSDAIVCVFLIARQIADSAPDE